MNAAGETGRPADELRVEQAFMRIATTRMAGLPILNDRLRVEALGFRDWQAARIGALVTPWSINLVILPQTGTGWAAQRSGSEHSWRFPSGDYTFFAHEEPDLGPYQQCSLFSPALEFATHEAARSAADAALEALMTAPEPERLSRRSLFGGT